LEQEANRLNTTRLVWNIYTYTYHMQAFSQKGVLGRL
jgi:hypothetical protein